jgi:hypothetical protein
MVARGNEVNSTWIDIRDDLLVHTKSDPISAIISTVYTNLTLTIKFTQILLPTKDKNCFVGYSCTAFQRNTIRTLGQSVLVVAIFG